MSSALGQDRAAGGVQAKRTSLVAQELQHQVEVVDHQIVHDADVGAAKTETAPGGGTSRKRGLQIELAQLAQAGLEALDVADGETWPRAPRRAAARMRSAVLDARAPGVFPPGTPTPRSSSGHRDLGVVHRRNGDARPQSRFPPRTLATDRRGRRAPVSAATAAARSCIVAVDDARRARPRGWLGVDARVEATEMTDADDADTQRPLSGDAGISATSPRMRSHAEALVVLFAHDTRGSVP